jgi:hypothetical protein
MSAADTIAPPPPPLALASGALITRDVNLRLNSWNSAAGVTLSIVVRMLGLDGLPRINTFTHTPNTDRSIKQTTHNLPEGWLLSVQALASAGTPKRGQCFVRIELIEGLLGAVTTMATLVQNYADAVQGLAWPGSLLESSTAGRGVVRSITGTDPAANTEFSETVPTGARWRLINVRAILVTDANVATRVLQLIVDDGTNTLIDSEQDRTLPASQSRNANWSACGFVGGINNVFGNGPLPPDLLLSAGCRIRSNTIGRQATDNWGAPQLLVEEWIEP